MSSVAKVVNCGDVSEEIRIQNKWNGFPKVVKVGDQRAHWNSLMQTARCLVCSKDVAYGNLGRIRKKEFDDVEMPDCEA